MRTKKASVFGGRVLSKSDGDTLASVTAADVLDENRAVFHFVDALTHETDNFAAVNSAVAGPGVERQLQNVGH